MKRRIYLGTYTQGPAHRERPGVPPSRGIYTAIFDTEEGSLGDLELAAELANPSYLAWHPTLPILYAVSEAQDANFQGGTVNVYRCNRQTGQLSLWSRLDSRGLAPCHIAVDPAGRFLVVSNYMGGNFALFSVQADGDLDPVPLLFQGVGKGPHLTRQTGPHAHSVLVDTKSDSLLMVDLGSDTIYVRIYDANAKAWTAVQELKVVPGSGCRLAAFSKNKDFLYIVGELDSTVSVFAREKNNQWGGPIQRVSTLPDTVVLQKPPNTASALCVHLDGKTVCVSNRGHGSLALFAVDETTGKIELIQSLDAGCLVPRFCSFDPSGRYFFVCAQDLAFIHTYHVDSVSGLLVSSGKNVVIDSPVYMLFSTDCRYVE